MTRYFKMYNGQWLQVDHSVLGEINSLILISEIHKVYLVSAGKWCSWTLCSRTIQGFTAGGTILELSELQEFYTKNNFKNFKKLLRQIEVQYG